MTTISSGSLPMVIAPQTPSPALSRVRMANQPVDPPQPSTTVTLGGKQEPLTYTRDSIAEMAPSGAIWQREANDAISATMATNGRNSVSSRFNGLADAVLSRFRTEGGSYSQSLILPSAATEGVSASALSSQLRGAPGTGVSLRIMTASGTQVDVKLGASADGIAVDIGVSEGELSEDERLAIAGLAKSFQDAVDGLGSVPPRLAVAGLAKFDSKLLASVSLETAIATRDSGMASISFQADAAQRSLTIKNATGVVTVNVDASQPTVVGSAQQRDAAVASYLQKFDAARSRGEGDQTLMSFFKEAFSALHQSYETAAPSPLSLIGKSKDAVPLSHRGALSGMADFSASITQGPVASNPYRTGEQDSFSFLATQRTSISGVQGLGVNVSQESETNLVASFHKPLPGQKELNLTLDPETQNYRYFLIEDVENSKTDLAYDRLGNLSQASRTESSVLSTRVMTYLKGKLVSDDTLPTVTSQTKNLMSELLAAASEAQRKGQADSSKGTKDAMGAKAA